MEINMTIERDGLEFDIIVDLYHEKASRGHCDRYGAPEEPDEPESLSVEGAYMDGSGADVELTEREEERAIEIGFEQLARY